MDKIRTVICDSTASLCEEYRLNMDSKSDFECVGTASCAEDCISLVKEKNPDLLLLDVQLDQEQSGIDIIRSLKDASSGMIVIMLSRYNDNDDIFKAIMEGADGYTIKNPNVKNCLLQIRKIYAECRSHENDQVNVMSAIKEKVNSIYNSKASLMYMITNLTKLSVNELEILRDIYDGMTYREIADKRVVEEGTIKSATSRILKKFNEKKMRELIKKLRELSIFDYMK